MSSESSRVSGPPSHRATSGSAFRAAYSGRSSRRNVRSSSRGVVSTTVPSHSTMGARLLGPNDNRMLERWLGRLEAGGGPFQQERQMSSQTRSAPLIGFHASHEQLPPSALLRRAVAAEAAGFEAAMCSDHFAPWSERQGHSGFAWSWLGAAMAATTLAVRRRQRTRSALPPGDHRAGDGDARRDVPRPLLGGARFRRGVERAHHRRPVADQARRARPASWSASRSSGRCCGRGGHP